MSNIIPFTFPETGQPVRVVGDHDAPLFHHGAVCKVLQPTNPSMAARMLDEDESVMLDLREITAGQTALSEFRAPATGNAEARFVTEAGLYTLVFNSKAPGAPGFRRWLTHEVIPQIRKTGSYGVAPREMTKLEALQAAIESEQGRLAAEARVAELEPAATAWNVLASGDGDFSVADAAKILARDPAIKLGRGRLFTILAEQKWTYRQIADDRPRAMQTAIERRWLSELPQSHYHPRTGELVLDPPQVRITAKGLQELHKRLGGTGAVQLPVVTS